MKICFPTCALAVTLLVAVVYTTLNADKSNKKSDLMRLLDRQQKERYEAIIDERVNIYIQSYILGLFLSFIFILLTRNVSKTKWGSVGIVCTVGAITLLVNYLYYMLASKSDYMILHLDTKPQRVAWMQLYRHMQVKYHTGLVLGVIAAMLVTMSIC